MSKTDTDLDKAVAGCIAGVIQVLLMGLVIWGFVVWLPILFPGMHAPHWNYLQCCAFGWMVLWVRDFLKGLVK